jgi:AcrR family transcriptional regulator
MATRTLSPDEIAATALDLVDRAGLEALSMRRLADELGVGTMTLYGYFRSKSELLDALMDESTTDVEGLLPEGAAWRERVALLVRAMRSTLERHPALVQIRLQRTMTRPRQFRVTEQVVRALIEAGLPRDEAARAFRLLFTYVFGFVAFSPSTASDSARREIRAALAALPPDEYPLLSSMGDEAAAAAGGDDQFDYGLELLLDGIEARAERLA